MDDSCAVCADPLEWVAYGPCGHREVCSTCIVRLRFVLGDRRCCICKTECPIIFVTKALGDYTRVVADFSVFLTGATEGKTGQYWYHEDTQAYFDAADHYKMIKAMCRLSCSICDKNSESQGGESTKRRTKFRNIEQLNGHLRHQHNLFMCNLCLEGRKVFICEQKLYTRSQLNQHKSTGDSEVDGNDSERGGFMGHPMCEFCRNRFYGDNELYMHMSTEHFTCHICQRQHPGQYDYFRDYNDLETGDLLMSVVEKVEPLTSSSSSIEADPFLKDITEKKLIFKKNVVTLAAELKDARHRLVLQEQSFAKEAHTRKIAETKARSMEEEIGQLQMYLQEKDEKLSATLGTTQQYMKELDDLKSQLAITQVTAEASAASAQSQCLDLLRELDEKNSLLEVHENRVNKLGKQIDCLQNDLKSRESSQRQLREEVMRIEKEIMDAVEMAGAKKDCELRKILAEVSPKNIENINKQLTAKDEEIARLRDEIRVLSTHWKQLTEELQVQLEQQRRIDQELKKRIKLEFCHQEARSQMRKLQKMGEKRDKAIKELKDQLAMRQHNCSNCGDRVKFWESQGFKVIASMSMLVLVVFAKK